MSIMVSVPAAGPAGSWLGISYVGYGVRPGGNPGGDAERASGRPGLGPYRNSRGQRPLIWSPEHSSRPATPIPIRTRMGHQDPPPPPPAPPPTPPPPLLLPLEDGSWLAVVAAEASLGAIWE